MKEFAYKKLEDNSPLKEDSDIDYLSDFAGGRRTKKKRADIQSSISEVIHYVKEVWTGCIARDIVLETFVECIKTSVKLSSKIRIVKMYSEFAHCEDIENSRQMFVFNFGCVVTWDFTAEEKKVIIRETKSSLVESYDKPEQEDMKYTETGTRGIRQDVIRLVSDDPLEKLAYSYAFAQSVKLSFFEESVDKIIVNTRPLPDSLAKKGTISASRHDISKKIGELFISRFYINLHTDILDTPDFFWEFDQYQEFYSLCRSYLEIPKRVEILNQRLDIIRDLYDMLNNELTIAHAHQLEWIVIYLICIEVVIEVFWNILLKDILKWV
eukprot:GHVP01030970.1.p1 GENE.GHVP01030970.1~~GHVP01030970.1.p1  ORF type:complete len:325 (-),score=42.83 GHVP01030970.1:33-1007(-)